jgi:hypothetical protein
MKILASSGISVDDVLFAVLPGSAGVLMQLYFDDDDKSLAFNWSRQLCLLVPSFDFS